MLTLLVLVLKGPIGGDLEEEIARTGVRSGLAVHLGSSDGKVELFLAQGGKILVHGLAMKGDDVARARAHLQAKGVYGLASVEKTLSYGQLPYADNLVNLMVADASLPTFSMKEILRVLVPKGVALICADGAWTKTVKPRPKEMDDWTHFDYGPEGNGVSHDQMARPSSQVQWSFGAQPIKLGGNPAGYRVYTGFRVSDGRAFFEWTSSKEKGDRGEAYYSGRDAFNGLPLWNVPDATSSARKEWQFVTSGDQVFAFLEKGGPLVSLDPGTGKVIRTYDQGCRLSSDPGLTALRVAGDTIVQSSDDTITSLDSSTGALRWKHREERKLLLFPSVSPKEMKVFAVVAEDPKKGAFSRWPFIKAAEILCLDLATGRELWRNSEVNGADIGQLVYAEGSLALFSAGAIGGSKEPYLGRIDAATGKLLWHSTFKTTYNRFGYNLLVRDGTMYYADAWRIYALDMKTGLETRPFDDGGYNMRCNRFSATDNFLIYGYVAYVDKSWSGEYQSITRGGCAQGVVPANGLIYFTPQACTCFTMLRGHLALSAEPLREPVDDGKRREKGPGPREPIPPRSEVARGPVVEEWTLGQRGARFETAGVPAGERILFALSHEHRLEARDLAGKALWSFTAGGRLSGPPLVVGNRCIFGCHDGWVYAVELADGTLAWRFQAAPYERKIVVDGQLESAYPVYGVVLHEGLLCFSAGLHPEAGNGIWVYGADPETGDLRWKKNLRKSAVKIAANGKTAVVPNRILNDVLVSDGKSLSLPGITFDPRTTDEELRSKIEGPMPKRK
jgi:outer membrane protein assembly factor BamB